MMAPHSKVTVCRMARHAALFHPQDETLAVTPRGPISSFVMDDLVPETCTRTTHGPDSIVVELSFDAARSCDHSTSAEPA